MALSLLLRNATLADGTVADIGIRDGKIDFVGAAEGRTAEVDWDVRGLTVLPGAIDTQVHFREPGLEHKEDLESGTRAALMGGVTSILEMPNTNPTTTSEATLRDKLARADGRAWSHYGFFVGASLENLDQLAELERLPGVPGIKVFMGSSTGPLLVADDDPLRNALLNGRKRVPVHAEDEARNRERKSLISDHPRAVEHPFLRDAESARLATERMLRLAAETKRPVHILHISTAIEPGMIADAKANGIDVTCEVTPQHLFFAGPECYERLGSLAQMNPPIRDAEHRAGLWRALDAGQFDVFGSDHAPHTLEEKSQPYPSSPSGMPGVQTLLPVLLTFVAQGRLSMSTLQKMLCERPAELYGIVGKGNLRPGFDADLVVVDPQKSYVFTRDMVESKCGWSPYEGETLTGSIEAVILNGEIAVREGKRLAIPQGKMLEFVA